mgnify:CR=1 FL=1
MKRALLIFGLLLICIPISYYYTLESNQKKLPIVNPSELVDDVVDPELRNKSMGHTIQEFRFLNQNNRYVDSRELEGKIWIVEYFFATCPSICPIMNAELQRVQDAFKNDDQIKILSFTVNPENDSVSVLKKYAQDHNAIDNKWHFFTGDKKELYQLARQSFFLLKPAETANVGDAGGDFIHTNNFVLIDAKKRIRGYYDGTNPREVNELISDIQILKSE